MIVGRDAELGRIEQLLADARAGRSSGLVLRGEPGIGKTTLLRAAAEHAGEMHVLRTRGIEAEFDLSYAGLLELLRPVTEYIEGLPGPQARALRAALAMEPTSPARLATAAAAMSLLVDLGEDAPVLVLVDDAQWLDPPTLEAVAVAARRLEDARVTFLFGARERVEHLQGLEELQLEPLTAAASLQLVRTSEDVSPELEGSVLGLARGNPLALLELPRTLAEAASSGTPQDEPLPAGRAGQHLFGSRLARLSEDERTAVLTVAAARTQELRVVADAWQRLGISSSAIEGPERERLVAVDGATISFRHPLVRSLAYAEADPPTLRRVHTALADALDGGPADEQTWHRALAALEPDAELAAALEDLARRSATPSAAADAFLRAARLTRASDDRARRVRAAAWAAHEAGRKGAASELASEALAMTEDTVERAELEHLLGLLDERPQGGAALMVAAAGRVEEVAPAVAARILADAVERMPATATSVALAERAVRLAQSGDAALLLLTRLRQVDALLFAGRVGEAERRAREAADLAELEGLDLSDTRAALQLAETLFSGGELDRARPIAEAAVSAARRDGALDVLWYGLANLWSIEWGAGRIAAGDVITEEELELADALGPIAYRTEARGHRACIAAARGREEECRRLVSERYDLQAAVARDPLVHPALGLLELGLGNVEAAANALERTIEVRRARGFPLAASAETPLLIEAYALGGRTEDALGVLSDLEESAELADVPFAHALAERCRGLLEQDFDTHFQRALEHHAGDPRELEHARTLLLYGERLRRARRRVDARERLTQAREMFERLGATLWSTRAANEIAATGERARRRERAADATLTPQEVRVARLVSQGLTNREIASQLFVSGKTVETHLRHAYQKLGVRSRTELAVQLAATDPHVLIR